MTSVVIVGAGLGGINQAIELRRHGFSDITILEKAPALGGTWFYNTYPGAACDVPSQLYSYSYAKRRDWSRLCSPQPEILDYVNRVAHDHGVDHLVTTGVEVADCRWDDTGRRWTVTATDGREWVADAVVIATGQLHRPAYPVVRGRDTFRGDQFHSAQWDHDVALAGKRVAVIGTGASAVQFIPEIAPEVRRLTVFQRSPNWFLARRNRAYPKPVKVAIRWLPGLQAFRRWFIFQYGESLTASIRNPKTLGRIGTLRSSLLMRWQLRDREVRRKAWPDYPFGCKRVLFSSLYLPALQRPNVELVTDRITEVTESGIRTAAGEYTVDCIIWATGFHTNEFMFPMEVYGTGGSSLRETWAGGAHAHLGMTVPGFPSLFILYGPNTNTSGGSIIFYLEMQAAYVRQALQRVRDRGAAGIEVRPEVEAASDREVQRGFAGTTWTQCDSWYRNESGRIVANWPYYMRQYRSRTQTLDPDEFVFLARPSQPSEPVG